jgi:heme-degrading monooxygenase HmoA
MFAVIYRWHIKVGYEQKFRESWAEVTAQIKSQYGTAGSRLHQADDGSWIAYALWPNRERWEAAGKAVPELNDARATLRECTIDVETLFRLEVAEDLLLDGKDMR